MKSFWRRFESKLKRLISTRVLRGFNLLLNRELKRRLFERHTSSWSRDFFPGKRFCPNFRANRLRKSKTVSNTILFASRHIKGENLSLPVDMLLSKTSLPNLSYFINHSVSRTRVRHSPCRQPHTHARANENKLEKGCFSLRSRDAKIIGCHEFY